MTDREKALEAFDNSFKKIPPRADRATPEGEMK